MPLCSQWVLLPYRIAGGIDSKGDGVEVREQVTGDVEVNEAREREGGEGEQACVRQSQHLQPLRVVEELLEVCTDGVVREIECEEGAETHEDVIRENGQSVMCEGEAEELESRGEHGRVKVLDVVVGEVQVTQGLGHLS